MAEVSKEKLAKLAVPEYEEYQRVLRRHRRIYAITIVPYFVISYAIYVSTIGFIFALLGEAITKALGGFGGCLAVLAIYAAMFGLGAIAAPLASFFELIANWFRSRGRREVLRRRFEPIEKEIEREAVDVLSQVEAACNPRFRENQAINSGLRYKRKWQDWYFSDLETVRRNCEENSLAAGIVDANLGYIKFDSAKKSHFVWFRRRLNNPFDAFSTLQLKLYSLYGKPDSVDLDIPDWILKTYPPSTVPASHARRTSPRPSSSNPLGLSEEFVPTMPKSTRTSARTPIAARKPEEDATPVIQPEVVLEEVPFVIGSRPADNRNGRRLLKPPKGYYEQVAKANMELGAKGELMVLLYEKRRVFLKEGASGVSKIEHVSVTQGDGLGYDIVSLEDDKRIYIEVKTTKYGSDRDLYFSEREFRAMEELDEKYYLYRVYDFDEGVGAGKLNIYRGKTEIEENFSIRTHEWVFRKN